jgi:predicted methyltransferase
MVDIDNKKIKRINAVLNKSNFKDLEGFVNHAVELLLFAEENKDKFNQLGR